MTLILYHGRLHGSGGHFRVARLLDLVLQEDHWPNVEALLRKYADRPISLADACLIRCAEIHEEARILTLDSDFGVYRWARNRRFQLL